MANKITYKDKVAIQNDTSIADENKVTDDDMNEIKRVVNTNADELTELGEKVDNFQNYDDTQIKAEITELKEENERLTNDINSISITEEAEGEDITLTETSDARFKKFEAAGNSYQETREGYNLFQVTATSVTKSGVTYTVNEDGSVTASGTSTGSSLDLNTITLQPGTYTFTGGPANGGENKQRLSIYDWTNNTADVLYFLYGGNKYTLTVEEEMVIKLTYVVQNGITVSNETIYPQIVQGSEEKPFEPYGAKPSLEYPSEIQTVNDNINFTVCNKNLAKINTTDWTLTENNTIKNKARNAGATLTTIKLKKGQTIKISFIAISLTSTSTAFSAYIDETYMQSLEAYYSSSSINTIYTKTYTATENCELSYKMWGNANSEIFEFQFWVELDEVSNYIVHESQSFTIPVQQEMLTGDGFVKIDGVWKELHNWTTITENGSTNTMEVADTGTTGKYRYTITSSVSIKDCATDANLAYCDKFKLIKATTTHNCVRGFTTSQNEIWIYDEGESLADFKAKIADNPLTFKIPLATAIYVECTNQQKQILDQIEKTIHSYKEKTYIYSTDTKKPIFSVIVKKDTQLYIDNKLASLQLNTTIQNQDAMLLEE